MRRVRRAALERVPDTFLPLAADLGDGLIYREAFTTSAAEQVLDHLVNASGLRPDRDAVPAPGKIVFVYRQARDTGYGNRS